MFKEDETCLLKGNAWGFLTDAFGRNGRAFTTTREVGGGEGRV